MTYNYSSLLLEHSEVCFFSVGSNYEAKKLRIMAGLFFFSLPLVSGNS